MMEYHNERQTCAAAAFASTKTDYNGYPGEVATVEVVWGV
jgi:hypothetical protein